MIRDYELDPNLTAEQRAGLVSVAEHLERDRPVPNPMFRGSLRRRLTSRRGRTSSAAGHFQVIAAGYAVAGTACLAIAAIGLVGVGPFAS